MQLHPNECERYNNYLKNHRERVKYAFRKLCLRLNDAPFAWPGKYHDQIEQIINAHDMSKYSPEEYEPYRRHWYPAPDEEPDEEAYNKAWIHHKQTNPHHYEYWKGKNPSSQEIFPYLVEMVCDWCSVAGLTGSEPTSVWFNNNYDAIAECLPSFSMIILKELIHKYERGS